MSPKKQPEPVDRSATLTIPELEQSKAAVLNTLASQHSPRSYEYAIERFIAWYCSAVCRASGVMTFIINQDGRVFQKDLGPDTAKVVAAMSEYNPDKTWMPAD